MDTSKIKELLELIKQGEISPDEGCEALRTYYFEDLGYAKIDHHRKERCGHPEVIYCAGKTTEQVIGIVKRMYAFDNNILGTRASKEQAEAIISIYPETEYNPIARTITITKHKITETESYIAIITAGTSDLPIAEEAYITSTFLGNKTIKIEDVGVAGIHRLFDKIDLIRNAKVLIVIAGMEGALASVVGGLVSSPIIAVPTSVGYGANFKGLSALLSMLNSCAGGISVVNIDNGYGAAYQASLINKL